VSLSVSMALDTGVCWLAVNDSSTSFICSTAVAIIVLSDVSLVLRDNSSVAKLVLLSGTGGGIELQ